MLEVLASRVCHDLISPVGAVHNVEFLQETGIEGGADAIALIAHSAQQAAAKLQIFRLAYGAGGRDPNIKPEDVEKPSPRWSTPTARSSRTGTRTRSSSVSCRWVFARC